MWLDDNPGDATYRSFNRWHAAVALLLMTALVVLPFFDIGPAALRELAGAVHGTGNATSQASVARAPATAAEKTAALPAKSVSPAPDVKEAAAAQETKENAGTVESNGVREKLPPDEAVASDAKVFAAGVPGEPKKQSLPVPPVAALFFDMREEELSESARETLAPFVAYLNENDAATVRVYGYYPRGDSPTGSNATLMWRRTLAVRAAFERAGIAPERVIALRPVDARQGSGRTVRRIDVAIASPASATSGKGRKAGQKSSRVRRDRRVDVF